MSVHLSNQGNAYIQIRINRNVSIAVIVSLLVHALLLFFLSRQDLLNQHQPVAEQQQTMVVRLNPKMPPKVEAAPSAEIHQPPPLRQAPIPKTKPAPVSHPDAPQVMAVTRPAPVSTPPPAAQRTPAPPKPATLDPAQFPDMASYLNAVREKRRLAGEVVGSNNEEAAAQARGPSEDEARMANIQRNLKQSGTNGVFQISHMDAHTATFSFRGWKNEYSYAHREVYQVDAGLNGDIERAVVRKMIEIIRRYYTGDFNWESQRLGRVVVLSARLQDNDGLEDVLLQEFFGERGISSRH